MARTDPQVNIRLPADLIRRIEAAAEANQRPFKGEIIARLEDSFGGAMVMIPADLRRRIEEAAKDHHRDFAGELMAALVTLYPAPTIEDVRAFVRTWERFLQDTPRAERPKAMQELAELLRKTELGRQVADQIEGSAVLDELVEAGRAREEGAPRRSIGEIIDDIDDLAQTGTAGRTRKAADLVKRLGDADAHIEEMEQEGVVKRLRRPAAGGEPQRRPRKDSGK